jgi:hypothetical protein
MPARLRPTAPIAADAILVGDPGRALMLAQELLQQPKMSNHARGMWGYTGLTQEGHELTVQSTGMGGPSATVVLHDLAELGARRAVRVGTCTELGSFEPGELVVVGEANGAQPDPGLTRALADRLASRPVAVTSLDALPRHLPDFEAAGEVVDMQTGALLIVSETSAGDAIGEPELEVVAKRAGTAAAAVLSP